MSFRGVALTLVVAVMVAGAACGKEPPPPPPPAMVPDGLVPEKVQDDDLAFYESTLPGVKDAFANAGKNSLAADGRLWELRRGDRLVGALQMTTLLPVVDLENSNHRDQILKQLLPTVRDSIIVDDVTVWLSAAPEKYSYLWFSKDMYALLTIKGGSEDELDPEGILTEVVQFSAGSENWKPLYIEEELEDL